MKKKKYSMNKTMPYAEYIKNRPLTDFMEKDE